MNRDRSSVALSATALVVCFVAGCSSPRVTSNPALLDPNKTSRQSGGTDDIYDATQEAINSLMADPARRAAMGAAGRKRAVERFAWSSIAEQTLALYRGLVSG